VKESQQISTNKPYVFIIDEINRGEMSKIFGELFFSLDPSYRGPKGAVFTQYANLHKNPTEKFYIPENVYIIGTMNDIDRSVDTFDFAMRRRFTFIEITAEQS
ncbi:AAA family ATPase, partial [Streptococcus suis]